MALSDTIRTQDCNLIAAAYERGAAYDPSEASVFAPIARNVQNNLSFAIGAQTVLSTYKITKPDSVISQGVQFGTQTITVPTGGELLSKAVKDCIPCNFRPLSSLDVNIGKSILQSLKEDVKRRLAILNKISDLLSNVDSYGDYCQLVSFLNFMCVPDLQRMLSILSSLLTGFGNEILSLNGLLQALISPFFTPVLLSIQTLLDQFVQLVLSPLNCIITSIQENIRKINIQSITGDQTLTNASQGLNSIRSNSTSEIKQFQGQVRSGLMELANMLDDGSRQIRNKLDFYSTQLNKVLGSFSANTLGTISTSSQKLTVIRLMNMIKAIIKVHNQGIKLCEGTSKPGPTELDNFFSTFISPTSPFNISVDRDGNLRIEEKQDNKPQSTNVATPKLLTPLFSPVSILFRCPIATLPEDIDKVNRWISELNQ